MPAVNGLIAGTNTSIYYSSSVISTKDESNLEAAIVDANLIDDVTAIGSLEQTRDIITVARYGRGVRAASLPGSPAGATLEFSVAMNFSDTNHTAFRSDDNATLHTFIVVYVQSDNNRTYVAFDAYIASTTLNQDIGDATTLDVTLAIDGGLTTVSNS